MKNLSAFFFALFIINFSTAQKPSEIFSWNNENLPTQHIYVQFDKEAYVAGDTAWFKAYLYSNYAPSTLSTNFFIDLVDEKGEVIDSKKLAVIDGTAIGNFDLPANLKQAVYMVRGYTKWITNIDQSFVFKKPLAIFNPASLSTSPATREYKFEIFPEGGKLLNGLPNNVAYRATDEQMQVVPARADLIDSKGNKIGNLADGKEGQGIFSFTPSIKEKYSVDVIFPDQSKKRYDFPAVVDKGIILTVADEDAGKSFSAIASTGFIKENETVELVATMDNNVVLDTKVPFKNSEALGIIATKNLHPGVLQVMLFDNQNKLLAERTAIVQNKKLTETVDIDASNFSSRPKAENSFTFTFPEEISGSFSIAITDGDKELAKSNKDIFSSLLVESGADHYIADPKITDEQSADLVTYPNNWYGSNWSKISARKQPVGRNEKYLTINGNVVDEKESPVTGDIKLIIQSKNLSQKNYTVGLSNTGNFSLDSLAFEDSARIYYQLVPNIKNKKPLPVKLMLKETKEDHSDFLKTMDYTAIKTKQGIFENAMAVKLAADIQAKLFAVQNKIPITNNTAPTITKKNTAKDYASGLFGSANGKTIDLIKEPPQHGGNILDYINGRIPGLQIYRGSTGYVLSSTRAASTGTIKQGQGMVTFQTPSLSQQKMVDQKAGLDMNANNGLLSAQVYLDEVESNPNIIATIPIEQIALVKYFEPGAIMIPGVGAGAVIAFWKKTEMEKNEKITDDMNYVMAAGYSPSRKFYSPDYSKSSTTEDNRTTLYWNPDIILSNEKQFTIKFFNSDTAKKFHLVLEGFTSDGKLVHFEKTIESP